MSRKIPILVIAGPTGVGKTALSLVLAKKFNGQVINADSMQVYRGLDIGTGKILPHQMQGVPHHLIDTCHPADNYDASRFQADANDLIHSIDQAGHLPILVGGTGLYLEGLLYDLSFGGAQSLDPAYRRHLEERAEKEGPQVLWDELQAKDPQASQAIPVQNVRRTIRALEVIDQTGQLFSQQKDREDRQHRYREFLMVLNRPRPQLYDAINQRVLEMVDQGLEAEVRNLIDLGIDSQASSMRGIGYKEWLPYFAGEADLQTTIEAIQINSRHYAKRQLTWFRNRMVDQRWLDVSQDNYQQVAIDWVQEFLQAK